MTAARQLLPLVLVSLATTLAVRVLGAEQTPAVFRAQQDLVPVYVTVTDPSGRLVTDLTAQSFDLLDNGVRQSIEVFDSTPQPIHLVVMLDVSGSMLGNLPTLRAACAELFAELRPEDLARVGTFGRTVEISPAFTRDSAALLAKLPTEIDPTALTPLWLAMRDALGALRGVVGRRVLVVLTDGKDNPPTPPMRSTVRQPEIVALARQEDVMIYAIGLGSAVRPGRTSDMPDPLLETTALDTGGGYFELAPGDDLAASFSRVVTELHSQYLLGFSSRVRDGQIHQIDVHVASSGLTARARKSYVAPTGQ